MRLPEYTTGSDRTISVGILAANVVGLALRYGTCSFYIFFRYLIVDVVVIIARFVGAGDNPVPNAAKSYGAVARLEGQST